MTVNKTFENNHSHHQYHRIETVKAYLIFQQKNGYIKNIFKADPSQQRVRKYS